MFRSFQTMLDNTGNGTVGISPYIESMEWDVYQITVQTGRFISGCTAEIRHNGFYLCMTSQGCKDSATGPPDVVVGPTDMLNIVFTGGIAGDTATVGIWYNENPKGTTMSTAH